MPDERVRFGDLSIGVQVGIVVGLGLIGLVVVLVAAGLVGMAAHFAACSIAYAGC